MGSNVFGVLCCRLRMGLDDESYVNDLDVVPQPKKRKMQQKQSRRLKVSIVHDSDEEEDEDYQNSDQEDVEEKLVPTEDENEELEPEPTVNALTLLRYQPPAQSKHARVRQTICKQATIPMQRTAKFRWFCFCEVGIQLYEEWKSVVNLDNEEDEFAVEGRVSPRND
jgi:hypothetical protein